MAQFRSAKIPPPIYVQYLMSLLAAGTPWRPPESIRPPFFLPYIRFRLHWRVCALHCCPSGSERKGAPQEPGARAPEEPDVRAPTQEPDIRGPLGILTQGDSRLVATPLPRFPELGDDTLRNQHQDGMGAGGTKEGRMLWERWIKAKSMRRCENAWRENGIK